MERAGTIQPEPTGRTRVRRAPAARGLGMYKAGQGYWVRVLTAVGVGILILAASAWLWQQLATVPIPVRAWDYTLSPVTGTARAGEAVSLEALAAETGAPREIGRGVVERVEDTGAGRLTMRVGQVTMSPGTHALQVQRVSAAENGEGLEGAVARGTQVEAFDRVYVQAGGVALLLILGAGLTYWLVAAKPKTVEFLIATDGEMKKVNWSTRKQILDSTWVVIVWSVMLAAGLFVVDTVFAKFFQLIGVLE